MVKRNNPFQIERLEDRQLMAGDTAFLLSEGAFLSGASVTGGEMVLVGGAASSSGQGGEVGQFPGEAYDPNHLPENIRDQDMGLPMLDSLPGARATLFLDFTGSFESHWWQTIGSRVDHYYNVVTPAYDTDFNPASFSIAEQQQIREIWASVAEDFAPFNVNVTTHYYGNFNDKQALKVAIGGEDDNWLVRAANQDPTGTSESGSFYNSAPNTVFVFEDNLQSSLSFAPRKIANTASHEAGHAFGLKHHSVWSAAGKLVNQYDMGTDVWTPLMGSNTVTDRTTWSNGATDAGPKKLQDDMKILAGTLNGFGYRTDDHGAWIDAATPLATPLTAFQATTGKGIISKTTDTDVFSFTTGGGSIQIKVNSAGYTTRNLIPMAQLFNAEGRQISYVAGTATSGSDPVINANLAAGTYYVAVKSLGDYGNVGQYTVSVKNVTSASKGTEPVPPKGGLYAMDGSPATTTTPKSKAVVAPKTTPLASTDGASDEAFASQLHFATTPDPVQPAPKLTARPKLGGSRYEQLDAAFAEIGVRKAGWLVA
jgi:hypothetical protein